jgi:thiamine biosynthesis protein ThiS
MSTVQIRLNGKPKQVPANLTLRALLDQLGLGVDGIAVAMDRRVIPKSQHATTHIPDGAEIEVIRAVGGG